MRWVGGLASSAPDAQVPAGGIASVRGLLRWVYLGRMTVAIVVFVAAAFYFKAVPPETILILAIAALATVIATSLSVWYTHILGAEPGTTFLYSQALFDLALITTVVHVTEGPSSQFPALYVLVIAVSAVMMPLASSLLITAMASLLYLADIVWWQPVQLSVVVWLQIAVFVVVFIATGLIASRVGVMGREREVLEQEVHRLKLEASDILRNINSGVVTVDGARSIVYTNPAAQRLLGIPGPEAVGSPLERVLGDSAPELLKAIELTQAGRHKTLRAEGTVRREGVSFPIGVTTTSISEGEGEVPSVTAIFTDISDQKRIQELRLRTERLEAVAELSASLAHEIKNPLASIRSSIEQLTPREDEDERFLAQLVVRESDRLSRLLTEFLDFSRVQAANCKSIDLGAVVAKAADVVRNHPDCPASAAIEVTVEKTALEGDEDLLHRVAVNLILNAVQATDAEVRVRVEARDAEASDLPLGVSLGHAVLFRVSDNGPGIPQDVRDRVFEPFVSGRVGGSGLGLAIVQRAVEAHDGVILVESKEGEGTVFSVLLPKSGTTEVAA